MEKFHAFFIFNKKIVFGKIKIYNKEIFYKFKVKFTKNPFKIKIFIL